MNTPLSSIAPRVPNGLLAFRGIIVWFVILLLFVPAPMIFPEIFSPLVLVSGLVIALSLWMMHRLVDLFNFNRLTIPSFFYFFYFPVIVVPGFIIFSEEFTPFRGRYLIAIESVLLTVPLGILIANHLLRFRKQEIASYFNRPVSMERLDSLSVSFYVFFLILSMLLALMYLIETPVVPLFYLIRNPGEALEVALLREDSLKLLNSPFVYAYYVLRQTIFPFLIMVSFGRYRQRKEGVWRTLFWISLFAGVIYAALTIEKSPVALIFGLIFTFFYFLEGGKVPKTAAITASALFLTFPVFVIVLTYSGTQGGTLWGALQGVGQRLFASPAQVLYNYFEVFPHVLPYQHGATITKLADLMGWKTYDIPNVVGIYIRDEASTTTANSCFLGNLNADFGLPGVVLGGLLAGFLMQAVHVHLSRKPKTVVNLAAYSICTWAFAMLTLSALPTALLSGGIAFALILRWIFRCAAERMPPHAKATPLLSKRTLTSASVRTSH